MRWLLLLLLCVGCVANVQPTQKKNTFMQTRESVVGIAVHNGVELLQLCGGTAFARGEKILIATAAHCDIPSMQLFVLHDGKTLPAQILEKKSEWYWDLMILECECSVPPAPVAQTELAIGDEVYAWQQPHGLQPILSRGIYQGRIVPALPSNNAWWLRNELLEMRMVEFSSASGSSGGAVFNTDGEAVGMIRGGFKPAFSTLTNTFIIDFPR
jgi:S1-C subfamily serine protease